MQMEISELSNQGSIEVKGWKISPYLQALVIIHNQYVYTYKDMIRQKDRNPVPSFSDFIYLLLENFVMVFWNLKYF